MECAISAQCWRRLPCWTVLLGSLVAACAPRVEGPAPLIGGATAERSPARVTIQRGQTLSEIAQSYHVPMRVIAEANGLSPPYHIQAGRTLVIPAGGATKSEPVAVAALPPTSSEAGAPPAAVPAPPAAIPSQEPSVAAAPLPPVIAPPTAPRAEPAPPAKPAPAPSSPHEPSSRAGENAPPPAAHAGGAFLWPVRGRILAVYGSRTDGTHNDGINIGAPKGTAVQAADAGIVAYTGNELRGYGNLILVKHANGWISAYAHCDQLLVKRGEKVARGQVIARVGSSGNVSEPQLHFELRRGHTAVDPREFLAPLPIAATKQARPG
jgi:murein DD-endopeptidase MepM/ murein hydrolase activator NlpD